MIEKAVETMLLRLDRSERECADKNYPTWIEDDLHDAATMLRTLLEEREGMRAQRIAYASEFPLTADGEPDVGNIHANIRKMKRDAARYRWLRDRAELPKGDSYYFLPHVFAWEVKPGPQLNELFSDFDSALDATIQVNGGPQ